MASDTDDNPFARNSVWPKMPQTPLRIRNLQAAELPAVEPPPTTVTPLFVRPMNAPQTAQLATGGGVPRLEPQPSPVATPASDTATRTEPTARVEADDVHVAVAAQQTRRGKPKPSRLPAIVATLVGIAGLVGLAWLLNRGREAPLTADLAVPTASSALPPAPTPIPQVNAISPSTPAQAVAPVERTPPPGAVSMAARPVQARRQAGVGAPEPDASIATSEALSGMALALPVTPPAPTYRPPPTADPAAPVVTRDPNS